MDNLKQKLDNLSQRPLAKGDVVRCDSTDKMLVDKNCRDCGRFVDSGNYIIPNINNNISEAIQVGIKQYASEEFRKSFNPYAFAAQIGGPTVTIHNKKRGEKDGQEKKG